MEIDGKDFLEWLHDIRRAMCEEERNSGREETDFLSAYSREAGRILGKRIPRISPDMTAPRKRSPA